MQRLRSARWRRNTWRTNSGGIDTKMSLRSCNAALRCEVVPQRAPLGVLRCLWLVLDPAYSSSIFSLDSHSFDSQSSSFAAPKSQRKGLRGNTTKDGYGWWLNQDEHFYGTGSAAMAIKHALEKRQQQSWPPTATLNNQGGELLDVRSP